MVMHLHISFKWEEKADKSLIITITISSNMIGALAALFFTNHSLELQPDSGL